MIRILTSLVAVLTVTSLQAQSASVRETPKLVIGITIDQLRGDYLDLFQHSFSEKGFKRLLNEGLVYENMTFNHPNLDDASSIATIYTGTTPFYHGIVGNTKYSIKLQREVSTFADDNYLGNYTDSKVSPLALQVSTITDELKLASLGYSDIYGLAPLPTQALASVGHIGNGAFWIDDNSNKWASSTFFKDFYWAVDQENRSNTSHAATAVNKYWNPLLETDKYNAFPYSHGFINFQHSINGQLFKKSPFVNENICDMAVKIVAKSEMGKRINPDFLALTLYAGNFPGIGEYSVEIQDAYIRLDKNIENLLNEIDKTVGLKNTFIFLTSTGYYNDSEQPNEIINSGTFYTNRCEALLNMYLMAIYGNNQWVSKYHNNQVYLDRSLIEKQKIPLNEIQQKSAEFIAEFTGVQDVYTSYQIMHGEWNPIMEYYKNGFTKDTSGDLFVEIQPGYKISNEQNVDFETKVIRNNAIVCPVIFFGNGIKPEKVKRTIKATEIAPSISQVLRIRPPNAAKDKPLSELF